jgi:hypothetical protein
MQTPTTPTETEKGSVPSDIEMPVTFNEPRFVTWWLGTLYLFKPADQVAIAQLLLEAVHHPQVSREISAFIALQTLDEAEPPEHQPLAGVGAGSEPNAPAIAVLRSSLHDYWRTNPWMLGVGAVAIVFFMAKGAWLIGKELFRIVF